MEHVCNDEITIYIISDSTGKTASTVVKSVVIQFELEEINIRKFTEVDSIDKLSEIIKEAAEEENVILAYTLVLPEFCEYIENKAQQYDIPIMDILGPHINKLSQLIDRQPQLEVGLNYSLDQMDLKRMEAIEFNSRCDDGRDLNKLKEADYIIIGVSRTSKTPLSMYLSHQKYRAATLSLSPEVAVPDELSKIPSEKIIGLTIEPQILKEIRQHRVEQMDFSQEVDYVKLDRIKEELIFAEEIMEKLKCRIVDITHKSIEETAAEIISGQKVLNMN